MQEKPIASYLLLITYYLLLIVYHRLKHKFLSLALVGLLSSFLFTSFDASAVNPKPESLASRHLEISTSGLHLEERGQQFYLLGDFYQAITLWQQAVIAYSKNQELLSQVRVMSNLALAYHQLGDQAQANEIIVSSRNLLEQENSSGIEHKKTQAQVINNQGILQLAQGRIESAIANWQEAKDIYQTIEDESGIIRASINLASAFKNLGLYRRAFKTLKEIEPILLAQPDSNLKAAGLRSYGDILRLVGNTAQAETILTESLAVATKLNQTQDRVKTLLTLGNTLSIASDELESEKYQQALKFYQQALVICGNSTNCQATSLPLQINLAQLNLLLKTDSWWKGEKLIPQISSDIKHLRNNQTHLYQQINFAHSLIEFKQKAILEHRKLNNTPSWSEIEQLVTKISLLARQIQSPRAESYGLGLQGKIAQQQQEWSIAKKLTQQALTIARSINAQEISYLWEWQLGRINSAQGDRESAISNYSQAVAILKNLSQDLVAIDSNIQYSFRQSVEPVYRELVDLLLQPNSESIASPENIKQARDVIESLQLAELHNFFREACLDAKPVQIDQIDQQAAAIYPIILSDRLEVILSLPNQPLKHYSVPITKTALEQEIEQFRQTVVIRSRRAFYEPAKKLYDWLIAPEIEALEANNIKTIVLVPDGLLRNIPLSALYDGEHYLIENYSVVLTSGLQLLAPRPLTDVKLRTLAVGLTQERQGFSALDFVNQELEQIQTQINSLLLVDQEFTTQAFEQEIKLSDYPIVHIATHGQFGSSLDNTFLLAWDDKININQLDHILQGRTPTQEQAIQLLVLSACETAAGDKWAALGLAGIAVRAGARSTLATLWSVNDEATAQMMSYFYQQLAKKQLAKVEAVRKAQLNLLNSPYYNHPFYWSPYVLLGNWL